ncbi:MAG: crosslink repair DNA glycosylase YcaQ family protein [Chloroflexota bacterium]
MPPLTLSPDEVRRLAVAAQWLEAPPSEPSRADMLDTIRQITCVQLDPINAVARSPLLVLFSRLGNYDTADLEGLLWEDRDLFEYWAHAASIVMAEDFPLSAPDAAA